ncbi:MAG: hypothetical protein R3B72_37395 [Polyangiaceae bacterium]
MPRGVQHLAPALARAIPAAVSGDKAWFRMPLGEAGELTLTLVVDAKGKLTGLEPAKKAELSKPMRRLARRVSAVLHAGRFAVAEQPGHAGRETYRITIRLTEGKPIEQDNAEPHHALEFGYDPPIPGTPGRAYFTYASGKHFEAAVTLVSREVSEEGDEGAGGKQPDAR